MRVTRYLLRPDTPWATPWHADSLFGALCWAYRSVAGSKALEGMLEQFRYGEPWFVLSDAFPAGLLPFPAGVEHEELGEQERKLKPVWVRIEDFQEFAAGRKSRLPIAKTQLEEVTRTHVSLSRSTNRALEGALFEIDEQTFAASSTNRRLALYVAATEEGEAVFRRAMAVLSAIGFGKKASSGSGAFEIEKAEPCPWLEDSGNSNGFVSLSHFVPAPADPVDGAWRLNTTYPKFQGNAVNEFLKGTITMMTPGSCFRTEAAPNSWYGQVIPMSWSATLPKAVHYAMCLAAPVRFAPLG